MSEMLGADVEQLRALAKDFSGNSQKLKALQMTIDGAVNQLPRYWQGPDAQRFAQHWRGQQRGVISRAALMLETTAGDLSRNADEQKQASSSASLSAGGPGGGIPGAGGPGGKTPAFQLGPDWLADEKSPFRNGWNAYNWAKLIPNMRADIFDTASMLTKANRAGFFSKEAWKAFQARSAFSQFANMSSDLFDGSWNKVFSLAEGSKAAKFFNVAGKGLGVFGAGLDALDSFNAFSEGKTADGYYSAVKAGLGLVSLAPPPVGTAAAIASGALFLYDNVPVIHDSVNYVGGKIADSAVAVGGAVADGAVAVGDAVSDGAKNVAKFFGF